MSAAQVDSSSAEAQHTLEVTVAEELLRLRGVDLASCSECGACTDVCPVASRMDVPPAELMARLKGGAGQESLVYASPWVCTDCRRCSVSCPVGIDVARAMEGLRLLARETGEAPADSPIVHFHAAFMDEIAQRGRLHELSLLWRLRHRLGDRRGRLALAAVLLKKGKISLARWWARSSTRRSAGKGWPGPSVFS